MTLGLGAVHFKWKILGGLPENFYEYHPWGGFHKRVQLKIRVKPASLAFTCIWNGNGETAAVVCKWYKEERGSQKKNERWVRDWTDRSRNFIPSNYMYLLKLVALVWVGLQING